MALTGFFPSFLFSSLILPVRPEERVIGRTRSMRLVVAYERQSILVVRKYLIHHARGARQQKRRCRELKKNGGVVVDNLECYYNSSVDVEGSILRAHIHVEFRLLQRHQHLPRASSAWVSKKKQKQKLKLKINAFVSTYRTPGTKEGGTTHGQINHTQRNNRCVRTRVCLVSQRTKKTKKQKRTRGGTITRCCSEL